MGRNSANATLRYAAFGPAVLLSCVVCLVLGCPADLTGQQDSPAPDEPQATNPPEPPASEPSPEAAPVVPPPAESAQSDKWAGTARDLPQDAGYGERRWGSEARGMGYTAMEVVIVALACVPVCFLGVFGLRVLVVWMESRKAGGSAARQAQWSRRESQMWRQEVRASRPTHRRK